MLVPDALVLVCFAAADAFKGANPTVDVVIASNRAIVNTAAGVFKICFITSAI
jgi:hypothetical protein